MTYKAALITLGQNLKALRKSVLTPEESRSINKFAKWVGVANGTVDRLEKGGTDPQLSHLYKIAAKFEPHGIRLWHLLVTKLDPMRPPAYLTAQEMQFHVQAEKLFTDLHASKGRARLTP